MSKRKEVTTRPMELSHQIFPRVLPHIYAWTKVYGRNFLCCYGTQAHMVVTDPELIKEVLNNKEREYPKIQFDHYMKKLLEEGTVTARGEKWAKLRKFSNHAECLKAMILAMITSVEIMLEGWRKHNGKEIEVFQKFKDSFLSNYLEGEQIFDKLTRFAHLIFKNPYKIRVPGVGYHLQIQCCGQLLKTSDDVESEKLEQGIRNSIFNMVRKREEAALIDQMKQHYGSDLLGLLVKASHDTDEKVKLSIDDVIDECKPF
ncbi:cytochrome P450, putative [Ricinus communis]|uniref:Cytochrome P450, putative n=1 Tax=Ricinus communis TaxID=3988 RepID=B9RE97_RICCO|nr:cytochrome P450, putative [Ricinus communis]